MFPGVLHVLYGCLIISVVRTSPHAFKIAVSFFHAFIVATSGKPIPESGLQGTDLMIWRRSAAADSRTGLHVPSRLSTRAATRLHTRPIPSVIAAIRRSFVGLSRAVQNVSIRQLTRFHALSEVLDRFFTRSRAAALLPIDPVVRSSLLQRLCIDRPLRILETSRNFRSDDPRAATRRARHRAFWPTRPRAAVLRARHPWPCQ
jgi:hypothetical protein